MENSNRVTLGSIKNDPLGMNNKIFTEETNTTNKKSLKTLTQNMIPK